VAKIAFTKRDEDRLASELAEAAKITPKQAAQVMQVLHVGKLKENLEALVELMGNQKTSNALGFSQKGASEILDSLTAQPIGLKHLRIGIKASLHVSGPHA